MANERDPILAEILHRYRRRHAVLADACGVTIQAINGWTRVPPRHCVTLEALTGIPREVLRPDIFGAPRPRPRRRVTRLTEVAA